MVRAEVSEKASTSLQAYFKSLLAFHLLIHHQPKQVTGPAPSQRHALMSYPQWEKVTLRPAPAHYHLWSLKDAFEYQLLIVRLVDVF